MAMLIDLALAAIVIGVTFLVAREGLWGAALVFFDTLFAGIVAFGTFEFIGSRWEQTMWLGGFPRFFSLVGIFAITISILRVATDKLAPRRVQFPGPVEQLGKYIFALATGWIAAGIIACMFQVAPVSKAPFGYRFGRALYGIGVDRTWLAITHYSINYVFGWEPRFPSPQQFIREYTEFRPFGKAPSR